MSAVNIKTEREDSLSNFLLQNDFAVEELENGVICANRDEELPVFIDIEETSIYFEVELGPIKELASQELFFKLLDANTEILPVSFGINSTESDSPKLVLVESREIENLSHREVLSVFDALELAADHAEKLLSDYIKK